MGVGSLGLLGLMTKFAIDSSPDLQAMIRFKAALARDFQTRGVEEVSLRREQRPRGFRLFLRRRGRLFLSCAGGDELNQIAKRMHLKRKKGFLEDHCSGILC